VTGFDTPKGYLYTGRANPRVRTVALRCGRCAFLLLLGVEVLWWYSSGTSVALALAAQDSAGAVGRFLRAEAIALLRFRHLGEGVHCRACKTADESLRGSRSSLF
jgi:hypothetical protein